LFPGDTLHPFKENAVQTIRTIVLIALLVRRDTRLLCLTDSIESVRTVVTLAIPSNPHTADMERVLCRGPLARSVCYVF
jgi:hypothetical protein